MKALSAVGTVGVILWIIVIALTNNSKVVRFLNGCFVDIESFNHKKLLAIDS